MPRLPFGNFLLLVAGLVVGAWTAQPDGRPTNRRSAPLSAYSTSQPTTPPTPERLAEILQQGEDLKTDAELHRALEFMRAEDFRKYAALWMEPERIQFSGELTAYRTFAVMKRWFEVDPASARQAAVGLFQHPMGQVPGELLEIVAVCAAKHDPAWAIDHLALGSESRALDLMIEEVARTNPPLALKYANGRSDPAQKKALLGAYVRGLADVDPLAAVNFALSVDKSHVEIAVETAARRGRAIARETLARIPDPMLRGKLAVAAVESLARETLTNPFEFLEEVGGLELMTELPAFILPLVKADPVGSANWAARLPEGSPGDMLRSIVLSWASYDQTAAMEWLQQSIASVGHTDAVKELKESLTVNRLLQEGRVDEAIETAARLTAVANASSTYADGVAAGLVFKIVEADLAKAAEWVLRDHTSPLAKTSAFVVSSKMTSDDPVAAANWIQQLPVGRTRDLALHGMITKLSAVDPEAASQWLSLYSSPDVRQRTVPAIFTVWNSIDSVAAGEWVRNLKDVDEKWKAKFMRQSQ